MVPMKLSLVLILCFSAFVAQSSGGFLKSDVDTKINHPKGLLVTREFGSDMVDMLSMVKLAIVEGMLEIIDLYDALDADPAHPTIHRDKITKQSLDRMVEIVLEMTKEVASGMIGVAHLYGFKPPKVLRSPRQRRVDGDKMIEVKPRHGF